MCVNKTNIDTQQIDSTNGFPISNDASLTLSESSPVNSVIKSESNANANIAERAVNVPVSMFSNHMSVGEFNLLMASLNPKRLNERHPTETCIRDAVQIVDARRLIVGSDSVVMNIITGVTVKQDDGYTDQMFFQLELELTMALRRPFHPKERYMVQLIHTNKGVECVVQMQSITDSVWSMLRGFCCSRFNITLKGGSCPATKKINEKSIERATVSKGLCEERLAMIEINRQAQGKNRRCRQFYPTNSGAQSDTSLDSVNNKPAKVKRFLVKKMSSFVFRPVSTSTSNRW